MIGTKAKLSVQKIGGLLIVAVAVLSVVANLGVAPTNAKPAAKLTKAEAQKCVKTYNGKKWAGQNSPYQDMHNNGGGSETYKMCFDGFSLSDMTNILTVKDYKGEINTKTIPCTPFQPNAPDEQGWGKMVVDCSNAQAVIDKNVSGSALKNLQKAICSAMGSKATASCENDLRLQMHINTAVNGCSDKKGDAKYKCIADAFNKLSSKDYVEISSGMVEQAFTGASDDNDDEMDDVETGGGAIESATNQAECEAAGGEWVDNKCQEKSDEDDKVEDSGTTCKIDGPLGWVLCPLFEFLGGVADGMYQYLTGFLEVKPVIFNANNENGAWVAYQAFLPFANILLAIAFLLVIYSEATGNGFGALSNYSAKKILPRLVVFAILVNLSWWICAAAADISNILGASLKEFFEGVSNAAIGSTDGGDKSWLSIVHAVVGGVGLAGAVAGVVVLGQFGALIAILLLVLLVIVLIILMLLVRQALIIMMIVLAPLGVACAVLPNTKSIFDKWVKLFGGLLVTYPAIALIYGASALASDVLRTANGVNDSVIMDIVVEGVRIIPLFAVPFLIFGCLNGFGKITAAISGFVAGRVSKQAGKIGAKAKSGYQQSMGRRGMVRGQSALANKGVQIMGNHAPDSWVAASGKYGNIVQDRHDAAVHNAEALMNTRPDIFDRKTTDEIARTGSYTDKNSKKVEVDDWTREAAIKRAMPNMSGAAVDETMEDLGRKQAGIKQGTAERVDFQRLAAAATSAAKDNGKGSMGMGDMNKMLSGAFNIDDGNGGQQLDFEKVADARLKHMGTQSESDLYGLNGQQVQDWFDSLERDLSEADKQNKNRAARAGYASAREEAVARGSKRLSEQAGAYVIKQQSFQAPLLDPRTHEVYTHIYNGTDPGRGSRPLTPPATPAPTATGPAPTRPVAPTPTTTGQPHP